MNKSRKSNARDWALLQLDRKRLPNFRPSLLAGRSVSPPEDPRDLALAEHIVAAVVKNLLHLQHRIAFHSGKAGSHIDPLVRKILAIAMAQLLFMDRIPAPAAVDEAVEQTRRFGRARAAAFVNAVLRNVGRDEPPAIPQPLENPQEYARLALSHPPELFRKFVDLLGVEGALDLCRHNNLEPPTIVRLFSGIPAELLEEPGLDLTAYRSAGLLVARGVRQPTLARWAEAGFAQVQDPTAAGVVQHLDLRPGLAVLDRCAGMGTKTLQIRDLAPDAPIVAMDPSAARCRALQKLLDKRQISDVRVLQIGNLSDVPADVPRQFPRILVDVPCSNSGVLARRPEARYAAVNNCLTQIQGEILRDSLTALSPGGILVYSTCSIFAEENQELVAEVLKGRANLSVRHAQTTLPSAAGAEAEEYCDGGYFAVIQDTRDPSAQ